MEKVVTPSGKTTTVTTTKTQNTVKVEKVTVSGGGSVEIKTTSKSTYSPKGIQRKRKKMIEYFCTQELKDDLEALKFITGRPFNKSVYFKKGKVVPDIKNVKTKFDISHIKYVGATLYGENPDNADLVRALVQENFSHRLGKNSKGKYFTAKGNLVPEEGRESDGEGNKLTIKGRLVDDESFDTEQFSFNAMKVIYYYYDKLDQTFSG